MKTRSMGVAAAIALLGAIGLGAGDARADGLAAKTSQVAEPARSALAQEIAAYKASHPEAFEAVRGVKGHRPEVYQKARNPVPAVGRELERLGAAALLPMLEALAFDAPAQAMTDEEHAALAAGMLQAVGVLRDARSAPVLRAIFEGGAASAPVLRAAARAMGQRCGDDDLSVLVKRSAAGDALRWHAVYGLGHCRRVEGAKHLAALLAAAQDGAAAQVIGAALGTASSSWAWKAMGPAAAPTGDAVREIAAKALVAAFVRHGGEARAELKKALLLADHDGTPALVAKARGAADAETQAALDALAGQLARAKRVR